MRIGEGKALVADCVKRGWVKKDNRLYTPSEAALLKIEPEKPKRQKKAFRSGDIHDELNIRNKAKHTDQFTRLIEIELKIEAWPEYRFNLERDWRFDYAFPAYKIAIEVQGGIWSKGNSGHSSGKGIRRDMQKGTDANINGWTLIQVEPKDLISTKTIDLVKKAIENYNVALNRRDRI